MDNLGERSTTSSSGDPDIDAYLSIKSSGSYSNPSEVTLSTSSPADTIRTKRRSISLGNIVFELPENWQKIKEEKRKSIKRAISQKDKFLGMFFTYLQEGKTVTNINTTFCIAEFL